MLVLIPFSNGVPQWPDDVSRFIHPGDVTDGGLVIEYTGVLPLDEYLPPDSPFATANEVLTLGGQPMQGIGNLYYGAVGAEVQLIAEIVDGAGNVQTQIDQTALGYPPVLKMPVVKFVGGATGTAVDEVYFNVALSDGVMTATGTIPSSGDWKLQTARLNAAIAAIGADWTVRRDDLTFLV